MSNAESYAAPGVDQHAIRKALLKFKTSFDIERKVQKRADELLSSSFNVFHYLVDRRSEKGELMLSNVLAMILNADGEHGQGNVFQNMFFNMVKNRYATVTTDADSGLLSCPESGYQVMVEENITSFNDEDDVSQKGRIDISLHHSDGWIVGIENKPFAGDQQKQVERYLKDMDKRTDARYGLIYLSGSGKPPTGDSLAEEDQSRAIADGRLCVLGYQTDLMPFLQSCSQVCKSPRFSVFLDDFANYVSSRFPQKETILMSDSIIIEELLDDEPGTWDAANLLREHYSKIVHRRGKAHFEKIEQNLPNALHKSIGGTWIVSLAGPLHTKHGYPLRIRNITWPSTNSFVIGFEYSKDDFRGDAGFGLIHDSVPVLKLEERLNRYRDQPSEVAPGFKETNYWLAVKTITEARAPEFVSLEMFVELTKELVNHYDSPTEQHDKGWLSSLTSLDKKNKAV